MTGQQSLHSVGAGFEPLSVGLMDKGFWNQFGKRAKSADGIGPCEVANFLFGFKTLQRCFGFNASKKNILFVRFSEVANDSSSTNQSMASGCFSPTSIGRNNAVGERL
jgi:hypothetical protein